MNEYSLAKVQLNNMARYSTATFDDLYEDDKGAYDWLIDEGFGLTFPETSKVYYNKDLIEEFSEKQNKESGFSPLGVSIHERTHASGSDGKNGRETGANAQTKAVRNIVQRKESIPYDETLDRPTEIYSRMMEFRYNHNLDPKKKYSSKEIQKLLDKETGDYKSLLQRYDIESLTKALNEVAYTPRNHANFILNRT